MMPFYGENLSTIITGWTRGKSIPWLINTGAAVTYTNRHSFETAFKKNFPKKILNGQKCSTANGRCINSVGVYEIDIFIKGRKCTPTVNVMNDLSNNILGIDFRHKHWLKYNAQKQQVKFYNTPSRTLSVIKHTVLPDLFSLV